MENNQKIINLIETGSDLAGAAIAGALGFLAAGPIGAAGAGALGVAISKGATKLLGDMANRSLSEKEKERVGATAAIALSKIQASIGSGKIPRADGFFDKTEGKRSQAEEIFEGILRKAKEEHEEKKLQYLGNFYHNLVYSSGVTVSEANYYLCIYDKLTYRQLCVLALILLKPQAIHPIGLRATNYRTNNNNLLAETVSLLQEIYSLYISGLVVCKSRNNDGYEALLGWHDVAPDSLELSPLGDRFSKLLFGESGVQWVDLEVLIKKLR